jgi:hypothetical protein
MKLQIPNTKHQTTFNLQTSKGEESISAVEVFRGSDWGFGIWRFVGVWCLEFGV